MVARRLQSPAGPTWPFILEAKKPLLVLLTSTVIKSPAQEVFIDIKLSAGSSLMNSLTLHFKANVSRSNPHSFCCPHRCGEFRCSIKCGGKCTAISVCYFSWKTWHTWIICFSFWFYTTCWHQKEKPGMRLFAGGRVLRSINRTIWWINCSEG